MDEIINQTPPIVEPVLPEPMPEAIPEKIIKKKLPIFIWIIPILFIILFYIIFKQQQLLNTDKQEVDENILPTPTEINNQITPIITVTTVPIETPDAKQTLLNLQYSLKVTSPIKESTIDWIGENGERIPLIGQHFSLGTFVNANMGKWGNFSDITEITDESLKPLQLPIETFFTSNNFQKDSQNSYKNTNFNNTKIGYTKGNLKCLITLSPCDPFAYFFCGTINQTQINWRKELFSAINPNNSKDVTFTVNKLIGNYATGVIKNLSGPGGATWFAVKVNEKWEIVWTTQYAMDCGIANKYNIPKEIYDGNCYNYNQ
jgi:hypothetical protein